MIVASILALVLSFVFNFAFPDDSKAVATPISEAASAKGDAKDAADETDSTIPASLSLLPVLSFFFGFYPKRAALAIERIVLKAMRSIPGDSYRALPLSMLAGMSYAHELRLEREGYDNVENLSNADAVDLAVRTCFTYKQLKQWIDQAWLAIHLREDYPEFVRRTGITSGEELRLFLIESDAAHRDTVAMLTAGLSADPMASESWKVRLTALKILLDIHPVPTEDPANPATRDTPV
jgi:hypothetical protein